MQSRMRIPSFRQKMSSAWRSPCPSQTCPEALRSSSSARWDTNQRETVWWISSSPIGSRMVPTKRRVSSKLAPHAAWSACAVPAAEIASDRRAPAWNSARVDATLANQMSTSVPSRTRVAKRRSAGSARMTTMWSIG